MHWKDHLIRKSKEKDTSGGMYSTLIQKVNRIRKDNDPPERDPESFSRYVCDLCHASGPLSGLRQCVVCGRWSCNSCWHDEYYLCRSCGGIMRLLLLDVPVTEKTVNSSEIRSQSEEE